MENTNGYQNLDILVVDDEEAMRRMIVRLLEREGYRCSEAPDAESARKMLANNDFALLLTDVDMPGASGLDLLTEVNKSHPDTATVMVTGADDTKLASAALDMGAYGYIIKPFETNELLINVANALRRRTLEIENRAHRERLQDMVRSRTAELWNAVAQLENAEKELRLSQEETIQRLSLAAEFRDDETARHIQRMSRFCGMLARNAGFDEQESEQIRVASIMHDVGKIGIPDRILLKPGGLNEEEREIMQQHTEIGYRILSGSSSELLKCATQIAWTHHEKMDGSGYPRGLAGTKIPVRGRIAAIADVFDALTTDRVYRKAFPLGQAIDIMKEGRGTHFDAELLDIFLGSLDEALNIKDVYDDYASRSQV